jgi:putative transposase
MNLARSTCRYKSTKDQQAALRMRLQELLTTRVCYGYRRLHILLRREGWNVNAKRVYRRYREEQLSLRTNTPRLRVSCRTRVDRPKATHINDSWTMDFWTDELFDGRRFRLPAKVDHFTRLSLVIDIGQRYRGRDVVEL